MSCFQRQLIIITYLEVCYDVLERSMKTNSVLRQIHDCLHFLLGVPLGSRVNHAERCHDGEGREEYIAWGTAGQFLRK